MMALSNARRAGPEGPSWTSPSLRRCPPPDAPACSFPTDQWTTQSGCASRTKKVKQIRSGHEAATLYPSQFGWRLKSFRMHGSAASPFRGDSNAGLATPPPVQVAGPLHRSCVACVRVPRSDHVLPFPRRAAGCPPRHCGCCGQPAPCAPRLESVGGPPPARMPSGVQRLRPLALPSEHPSPRPPHPPPPPASSGPRSASLTPSLSLRAPAPSAPRSCAPPSPPPRAPAAPAPLPLACCLPAASASEVPSPAPVCAPPPHVGCSPSVGAAAPPLRSRASRRSQRSPRGAPAPELRQPRQRR
eukprot:Hpha_TRINITY_DN9016_c0_g2::TRINITY_DN9016_c0_g2_i1::g.141787::m.141787